MKVDLEKLDEWYAEYKDCTLYKETAALYLSDAYPALAAEIRELRKKVEELEKYK